MTAFDPRTVQPTHPHHAGQSFSAQQLGAPTPGRQYPGPVRSPRRPLAVKIVGGLVAVGLFAGGAGAWLAFSGGSAEAAIQTTSFAGANPTTSPFGTDAPKVAAVAATGPRAGDTAGLYAATTPPACTTADFLAQLQADPAKLAAFGGVYDLGAADVPAFVNSLAPVVLRANTSVTDHPFVDGAFVPQPAVLAAGTAVLVNSYGEPTVKCYNGNPLTAGAVAADAVTITPTAQVITQYSFTTIDNSRVVVIPGKPDPKPHPGPNPDPFLAAKADAAEKLAQNARTDATTARADATTAADRPDGAQANLDAADVAVQQAKAKLDSINPQLDPVGFAQAQDAAIRAAVARQNLAGILQTAKDQAAAAATKAKDLEDKATADEQAAAKAKQDAEDSGRPHQKQDEDQGPATKVDDPAAATGQGETDPAKVVTDPATAGTDPAKAQPATVAQPCPVVVADTTTLPAGCKLPTGSADSAPKARGHARPPRPAARLDDLLEQDSGSTSKDSGSSTGSSSSKSSAKGGSDQ